MIEAGPDMSAELEAREERVREIEQMVKDQPEEMATLLRGWLAADSH
jgi:flagellar M-ring protein FliF